MPFYLAWVYSKFSRWNFKFFSNSELPHGTNQDFMPFIQAQFFGTLKNYTVRYLVSLHIYAYKPTNFMFVHYYQLEIFSLQISCPQRHCHDNNYTAINSNGRWDLS